MQMLNIHQGASGSQRDECQIISLGVLHREVAALYPVASQGVGQISVAQPTLQVAANAAFHDLLSRYPPSAVP
jgi:hypothetical protein